MRETRICLVRHGETDWNVEVRLQGHEDIPLNTQGIAQAKATAAALQGKRFAAMYSSDLGRAVETARFISESLHLQPRYDERLRERHFGGLQGLTREDAEAKYPGLNSRIRAREVDLQPPGSGETLLVFSARVTEALEDIAEAHPGEDVLVVSHGGCLDIMYRRATGKPLAAARDFPLSNAALNWISHTQGVWRMLHWDDRTHLEEARDDLPV